MRSRTEFRVTWARIHPGDGQAGPSVKDKSRTFRTRHHANRWIRLLGPEPWTAYGVDPDEFACCSGIECGCGGLTNRQSSDEKRKGMPPVKWILLEMRQVTEGPWEECVS